MGQISIFSSKCSLEGQHLRRPDDKQNLNYRWERLRDSVWVGLRSRTWVCARRPKKCTAPYASSQRPQTAWIFVRERWRVKLDGNSNPPHLTTQDYYCQGTILNSNMSISCNWRSFNNNNGCLSGITSFLPSITWEGSANELAVKNQLTLNFQISIAASKDLDLPKLSNYVGFEFIQGGPKVVL